jgi:hypothetical protein
MSTYSSKAKSRQVKTTIKETNFFCIFDKNDASKNKVKQNLKKSKGCACKTPLTEVFFFSSNGAKKLVDDAVLNSTRELVGV